MSEAIAQIIKYEGDNQTFVWKHPIEDFNSGTQLIVHESQEAVFFMNGQTLDTFGAGRHTLTTQNIPLLSKIFNRITGDQTPFHCELYFINKTEQMAIIWGTNSKMEYVEPTYGFPIQIGASGEMNLKIEDGRKLLIKIIGTEDGISQDQLVKKFRAFLMMKVKPYIVTLIRENKINIFQIDEHLQAMSETLHEKLRGDFLEYGVSLERFFLTTILKPEEDKNYQRFKQLHFRQYADVAEAKLRQQVGIIDQQTSAQRMVIEAQGIAQKRSLEGYTYQDERGFDVAERVASNEAVGQFTNMGIGMGMITGVGGTVSNQVGSMLHGALSTNSIPAPDEKNAMSCTKCGAKLLPTANFCQECGEKVTTPNTSANVCPNCGARVLSGKFCSECGASLASPACPKCGKPITAGAKFCLECGEKLL